jgi:hypothetical protein
LDRAVVVLPGARAGRRLLELLLGEAERMGLRLIPPRLTTLGALPELLYRPEHALADPILARRVWALALAGLDRELIARVYPQPPEPSDLRGWATLARQVERLHSEIGGAGLRFRDLAAQGRAGLLHDDGARWEVLAEAQDSYLERLAGLYRSDRESARLAAVEHGEVATDRDLWLVGIAEMPVIARRMIRAVAASVRALVHAPAERAADFDAEGCVRPGAWLEAEVPVRDEQLRLTDRPADQAAVALEAITVLGGHFAAEEITIGVPDHEVVPFLEQRFTAAGLPVRYATGSPLHRTGPYRLLEALANYLDGRRFHDLSALFRHPDLWHWLRRRPDTGLDSWLGAADRYFGASLPAHLSGGLAGGGPDRAAVDELVRALEGDDLLGRLGGKRRLAEWAPEILRLLVEVYGAEPLDRTRPGERRIVEACERIRGAAVGFHLLPAEVDEPCTGVEAMRHHHAEAGGEVIAPEAERAAIEILGWLELHLDDAPVLIVTGANEPYLPESVNADAFLPNALRARLGLVDNDLRYARDAYQLTAILHSRPEVRLISGRRNAAGDPLRPSRLLFAAPPRKVAERVHGFFGEQGAAAAQPVGPLATGASSRFQLPPEPVIRAPAPITSLRVTDFRALLADPYRFALERVFGLEALDDEARELDGLLFGSLAHDVLQRFGEGEDADSTDAAQIMRRLDTILGEEVARRFGRNAMPAVRVQVEQLRARLHAFAEWQAAWAAEGWRIVATEVGTTAGGVPFDVDGEPIMLRGRIDRIDHHAGRGEWAVFDYKTGDAGDAPEKTHRAGRKDERRWIDLQLPLYLELLPELRREGGEPVIPPERMGEVRLGYILLPRELAGVGAALADWDGETLRTAAEAAREVVRTLRESQYAFEFSEDRITSHRGDPLAALLGVGQLAAALDDDDGEGGEG